MSAKIINFFDVRKRILFPFQEDLPFYWRRLLPDGCDPPHWNFLCNRFGLEQALVFSLKDYFVQKDSQLSNTFLQGESSQAMFLANLYFGEKGREAFCKSDGNKLLMKEYLLKEIRELSSPFNTFPNDWGAFGSWVFFGKVRFYPALLPGIIQRYFSDT